VGIVTVALRLLASQPSHRVVVHLVPLSNGSGRFTSRQPPSCIGLPLMLRGSALLVAEQASRSFPVFGVPARAETGGAMNAG